MSLGFHTQRSGGTGPVYMRVSVICFSDTFHTDEDWIGMGLGRAQKTPAGDIRREGFYYMAPLPQPEGAALISFTTKNESALPTFLSLSHAVL